MQWGMSKVIWPSCGPPLHSYLMEPIDLHRERLEPLLDQIPINVIQVTT
jgi:hypothetical protein